MIPPPMMTASAVSFAIASSFAYRASTQIGLDQAISPSS